MHSSDGHEVPYLPKLLDNSYEDRHPVKNKKMHIRE